MRSLCFAPIFALVNLGMSISFINPPPAPTDGAGLSDPSLNPVYPLRSTLNIQWTAAPSDTFTSLVIYQSRPGDAFDYLNAAVQGVTTFNWPVTTAKNLSETPIFFFQIFINGQTAPAATSRAFNLTSKEMSGSAPNSIASTSTSSSSTGASTISAGTSLTSSLSPTTSDHSTITLTASSTPVAAASSSGVSTGFKIGLGVGISLAVILSFAAGWFVFGHYKKPKEANGSIPMAGTDGESTRVYSIYSENAAKKHASVNPAGPYEL